MRETLRHLNRPLPDVVKQLDQVASTQMTVAGVLIAFYSGAIFAGKVMAAALVNAFLYALPLCLLLATIVSALRVFYPGGYLNDDDETLIKKVAIAILIIAVIVYLLRPAA
jgi:ABC-type multidrug transport system permease subunit